MYRYYIGIDCGVNTGIAIYDREKKDLIIVDSDMIHITMDYVRRIVTERIIPIDETLFVVEDARQVVFNTDKVKAQGAGSVKRDAKIWADYLDWHNIPHLMVRPKKAITKLSAERFKEITGWSERTNNHGRDAAMLVWGATYTPQQVLLEMEKLKGKKSNIKITRNNLLS
jgi:hypothetical protein